MWNLGVVSWLYGKRCAFEKLIGYHIFFDVLCDAVANNQVTVTICGFYDRFTLLFY